VLNGPKSSKSETDWPETDLECDEPHCLLSTHMCFIDEE
jgi:hypothetical protein